MSDEPVVQTPGSDPREPEAKPETGPASQLEAPEAPEDAAAPAEAAARKQFKVALGAVLAIAVAVGLYFANRFLVKPATRSQVEAGGLTTGSGPHPKAPEFTLADLSGQKINLEDYKGKVVLVDFWATWCGPCRLEIPGFVDLVNKYRDQGFAVIGVSMDDGPEPVREFYKKFKMNYPVGLGDDKLSELYGGVLGLPTSFLIGRDGRIYAKHVGATDPSVFETEVEQLLAAKGDGPVMDFRQTGMTIPDDKIEVGTPAEVNSEVPGVDLSNFTEAQKKTFEAMLARQNCTCGCKLTLLRCRQIDRSCGISLKAARDLARTFEEKKPGAVSWNPAGDGVESASTASVQN